MGFLDRFKEWTQLRGTAADARNVGIFLHGVKLGFSAHRLMIGDAMVIPSTTSE